MSESYQQHALNKLERQARALVGGSRHTPTSAELKLARHMAAEGCTLTQIRAALGWDITLPGLMKKLRKYNIRSRARRGGAGRSKRIPGCGETINCAAYRPKALVR